LKKRKGVWDKPQREEITQVSLKGKENVRQTRVDETQTEDTQEKKKTQLS